MAPRTVPCSCCWARRCAWAPPRSGSSPARLHRGSGCQCRAMHWSDCARCNPTLANAVWTSRMVTFSSAGARGGLLRFPLPGPSAEGTPGSAAQKTRRGPSAIVRRSVTFEEVVREHQDAVYGAALRILGDRDAALDAANQTFMKAYRSRASYDPSRPIRHWLLRIAINEAITIGRARTRERARHAPEAAAAE